MLVKRESEYYSDFKCPKCSAGIAEDEPFAIPSEGKYDVSCPECNFKFIVEKVVTVEWKVEE